MGAQRLLGSMKDAITGVAASKPESHAAEPEDQTLMAILANAEEETRESSLSQGFNSFLTPEDIERDTMAIASDIRFVPEELPAGSSLVLGDEYQVYRGYRSISRARKQGLSAWALPFDACAARRLAEWTQSGWQLSNLLPCN